MGGILIIVALNLTTLLWAQWNTLVQLTLLSVVVLTGLGFYDDYAKITQQTGGGAKSHVKLWVQFALAIFIGVYLWRVNNTHKLISEIIVPFYKVPGGDQFVRWTCPCGPHDCRQFQCGESHRRPRRPGNRLHIDCGVRLFGFDVFGREFQNSRISPNTLRWGAGELTVFCAAMIGAGLGFLWYNCHPAQMFMGDTGSLALGGALGIIAVLLHQPLLLVIAGGVFVMEAFSVILQTSWFRFTRRRYGVGRRIFLMAPIHHHFEKKGWYESQVVMRFYILGILFAVVALSTLKLR